MKRLILLITGILLCISMSFAQSEPKIANLNVDVKMVNDGEGRIFCYDSKNEKPVDGPLRIIEGRQSQYIDAEFKDGYATGTWKSYSNNKLVGEGVYKNGFPDGDFKEFFEDGKPASVQKYTMGKRDGKWISYFTDGKVEEEKEFKNGELDGVITVYYSNGKKKSENGYKAGKEDGVERKYDEDGNLKTDITYKDGKRVGKSVQQIYSNIGDYVITSNYKDGVLDGDYSEIFDDGTIKSQGSYAAGKKQGRWDYRKSNGDRTLSEEYDKGDLVKKITYYTNGEVEVEQELKDGKKHGVTKKYDNEGNLKSEERFRNGKEEGLQVKKMVSNVANYTIKSNYANGKLDGAYLEEYDNGKTKVKGAYIQGKKNGTWEHYDAKGKKQKEEKYDNGKQLN